MSEAKTIIDGLSKPFEPHLIRTKPGSKPGAANYKPATKYVSHGSCTKRLNAVCPGWSTRLVEMHSYVDQQGKLTCAGVTMELSIPGVGSRVEFGTAATRRDFGSDAKNAMSDALKRCAMRFGVALDLWEDLDEHDEDAPGALAAPPAFATPTAAPAAAPSVPADSLAMARRHALKQFGPLPTTLPDVEAQLHPLAKQVRTNDESLSSGEYQRYHDLEAQRKELLPRLTEAELTATIDQAWANAEDGWALGGIRDDLNRQRHRMSKEQMDRTRDELAKIAAKFYTPASYAG